MSKAFAVPVNWLWLSASMVACATLVLSPLLSSVASAPSSTIWFLMIGLLLIVSTHQLVRAAGVRHGWSAGLALAGALVALPALSLRPEALTAAAAYQAEDLPWPDQRPTGHLALLSCDADCVDDVALLLHAGAYSVFVPDKVPTDPALVSSDLVGNSLRSCGPSCTTEFRTDLSLNDWAYWSGELPTPGDPHVSHLTRQVLLHQTEGEWSVVARDTTVHLRSAGPWPTRATIAGARSDQTGPMAAFVWAKTP